MCEHWSEQRHVRESLNLVGVPLHTYFPTRETTKQQRTRVDWPVNHVRCLKAIQKTQIQWMYYIVHIHCVFKYNHEQINFYWYKFFSFCGRHGYEIFHGWHFDLVSVRKYTQNLLFQQYLSGKGTGWELPGIFVFTSSNIPHSRPPSPYPRKWKMYLSKLQTVFVQITKWFCLHFLQYSPFLPRSPRLARILSFFILLIFNFYLFMIFHEKIIVKIILVFTSSNFHHCRPPSPHPRPF